MAATLLEAGGATSATPGFDPPERRGGWARSGRSCPRSELFFFGFHRLRVASDADGDEIRASSHVTVLYVCRMIAAFLAARLLDSQRKPNTECAKNSETERTWTKSA